MRLPLTQPRLVAGADAHWWPLTPVGHACSPLKATHWSCSASLRSEWENQQTPKPDDELKRKSSYLLMRVSAVLLNKTYPHFCYQSGSLCRKIGGPWETHVNCWKRSVSRPILDEDFKKICLQFFKVKCQGQSSKSLKCLVWTWNKLHLIRNLIFWVKYNQSVNFIHKDLVFFKSKFKSEVNKYIFK